MAEAHERLFYETMWRHAHTRSYPLPWWCQQYFRSWSDDFDSGLFASKEAAFASNAHYRYWHMVGVKDHSLETLVGQAGELEPVYDRYAISFFLFDPTASVLQLPQFPGAVARGRALSQSHEQGYLPIIHTHYRSPFGLDVQQEVHATVLGVEHRSVVLVRFRLSAQVSTPALQFGIAVAPAGPTGFQRHDKAGRYTSDTRITYLHWNRSQNLVELNATWGPVFRTAPQACGLYGNGASHDPDHYVQHNPWADLLRRGELNGHDTAVDNIAGLCTGAFTWSVPALAAGGRFELDLYLPVDDYRNSDLPLFHAADPSTLAAANRAFWTHKLEAEGPQLTLPTHVTHLCDLYRICRANLLILADDGEIHPGPTIYDSFWIRDSSIEAIACALAGDTELASVQIGEHYPRAFHRDHEQLGPVDLYGFFGGEHEKNDREWDSNGEALWAIGKLDRILGPSRAFWPFDVLALRVRRRLLDSR